MCRSCVPVRPHFHTPTYTSACIQLILYDLKRCLLVLCLKCVRGKKTNHKIVFISCYLAWIHNQVRQAGCTGRQPNELSANYWSTYPKRLAFNSWQQRRLKKIKYSRVSRQCTYFIETLFAFCIRTIGLWFSWHLVYSGFR